MTRLMRLLGYVLLVLCSDALLAATEWRLAFVGDARHAALQVELQQGLQVLAGKALRLRTLELSRLDSARDEHIDLLFSADAETAQAVVDSGWSGAHVALAWPRDRPAPAGRFSALYADATAAQWQALLRALPLQPLQRAGMVFGVRSGGSAVAHFAMLPASWHPQPLFLRPGDVAPPFISAWLNQVDVWWIPALRDGLQARDWESAALLALHAGRPIVGHERAQLEAGAWLALYADDATRARMGSELALNLLRDGAPQMRDPEPLTLALNYAVAQRLQRELDVHQLGQQLPFRLRYLRAGP